VTATVARRSTTLRLLVREPVLVLWAVYVLLIPLYLFSSGLPQPSDFLLLLILPLAFQGWSGRLYASAARAIRVLLWFTIWVIVVDFGWAALTGRWALLTGYTLYPLFYVFNLGIFTAAAILHKRFRDVFLRVTVYSIYAGVVLQVIASFLIRSDQIRGTMFFNNPNQLGYYALLAATLIVLAGRKLQFGTLRLAVGLTGCAYLGLLSASRASLGGIAVLVALTLFSDLRVIVFASVAAIAMISVGGPVSNALDESAKRLEGKHNGIGFAEERGYDRVWQFKEYMIVGAGEGDNGRFDPPQHEHELHSSFATVAFCYGVLGAVLFSIFGWLVLRGATFRVGVMLAPVAIYMTAHQGLRFTLLWVLLSVFIALKDMVATAR